MTPILPPHNQEAEQGLIGVLLAKNETYDLISNITIPEHFFIGAHQRIYQEISKRLSEGQSVSPVSLKLCFEKDADLEEVGGSAYISDLLNSVIWTGNAVEYANNLKDLYERRELLSAAQAIQESAQDYSYEKRGFALAEAERLINAIGEKRDSTASSAGDATDRAFKWIEAVKTGKVRPFQTGLPSLDQKIGGFHPGRLYILAARPAMGKTALGVNIADNISTAHPALFISLEMTAEEIGMRLTAARTDIAVSDMQSQEQLPSDAWNKMVSASAEIKKRNLTIEDCSGIDVHGIKSIARKFKRQKGKFLLVIDYLGLIQTDPSIKNKVHQIEDITTNLKRLAKELSIPVLLLCQLSRAVEGREDRRPGLSDLRDSGAIEQDADVVVFIYREEYYADKSPPVKGIKDSHEKHQERLSAWEAKLHDSRGRADLIIAKNRQGICASVKVKFDGRRQLFYE